MPTINEHPITSRKKWTMTALMELAAEYLDLKTLTNEQAGAYMTARRDGVAHIVFAKLGQKRSWTKAKVIDAAIGFQHRADFERECGGAVSYARKHNLMDDICAHMTPKQNKWNPETVMAAALKYKQPKQFKEGNAHAYRAAWQLG